MSATISVDLGKTGCRAELDDIDGLRLNSDGDGAPGLAESGGVVAAAAAVLAVCGPLLTQTATQRVGMLSVGAAGAMAAPDAAAELAALLLSGLATEAVAVSSDAITSHAGALAGGPGVVLAAGTGSVALGLTSAGVFSQVDGWGPWLGDEGSGGWIGLAGLRAALRDHDGRGPATTLRPCAQEMFGDLTLLPRTLSVGANQARTGAEFAPAVAGQAERRDAVAVQILTRAGQSLAETIVAAARPFGSVDAIPVAVVGGLRKLGPVLLDQITAVLTASGRPFVLQEASGGSLDGARRLGQDHGTPHEPHVVRKHATSAPRGQR